MCSCAVKKLLTHSLTVHPRWFADQCSSWTRPSVQRHLAVTPNVHRMQFVLLLQRRPWLMVMGCWAESAQPGLSWSPLNFYAQIYWLNFTPSSSPWNGIKWVPPYPSGMVMRSCEYNYGLLHNRSLVRRSQCSTNEQMSARYTTHAANARAAISKRQHPQCKQMLRQLSGSRTISAWGVAHRWLLSYATITGREVRKAWAWRLRTSVHTQLHNVMWQSEDENLLVLLLKGIHLQQNVLANETHLTSLQTLHRMRNKQFNRKIFTKINVHGANIAGKSPIYC